jgi:hypothetical protein
MDFMIYRFVLCSTSLLPDMGKGELGAWSGHFKIILAEELKPAVLRILNVYSFPSPTEKPTFAPPLKGIFPLRRNKIF